MKIKLSVIVPVYNVEKYIEECISSLLNQTIKEIEIIVVDDGSCDNSIELVKRFKDKRIKIIYQENKGLSAARNTGIREANGDYIVFIDSDDFIDGENSLKEMYNIAIKYDSDIVIGNAVKYYSENQIETIQRCEVEFYERTLKSKELLGKFYKNNLFLVPVCFNMYRKRLIEENKLYFKEGILHEDELFTPQIFIKANNISIYPKNFYIYRQRQGSIIHTKNDNKGKDLEYIYKQLLDKYIDIEDIEYRSFLEYRIAYLVRCILIDYDEIKVPMNMKINMIKKSQNLKLFILNILLVANPRIYKYIIGLKTRNKC